MTKRESYNAYMREYNHKRYHQKRQWAVAYLGGKCTHCGSTGNLEVDHIDPHEKTMGLTRMTRVTQERFVAELDKCQLLCHDCHVQKTMVDGSSRKNTACGERVNHAKLTTANVRAIRQLYGGGISQQVLAGQFGVSRGNISQIVTHRTWKHV